MSPPRLPRSPLAMWPHNALLAEVPPYSQFARRTTALWRHIGSGCRRWVGPVLADDHVSGLRVSRPVDVSRTYQDLSLGMVRNTRRISTLTPSAGHHWWYGDFATGMASACPPAVSAI